MRFVVPQFIDVEDKVLGPITARQFLMMLVTAGLIFVAYKTADFVLFLIITVLLLIVTAVVGFMKVNGMPFHFFMLNIFQTSRRPKVRVWNKDLNTTEIKQLMKQPPPPKAKPRIEKAPMAASRLAELTLVVNTGGVYDPDSQ